MPPDERSNWSRACAALGLGMPLRVELLIAVGRSCGLDVAAAIYRSLAAEPIDEHGRKIDWQAIARAITG